MISVIIPTFNSGKYLREAINSVFNQTFSDFEILVIDDGSTDNTKDIVLGYEANNKNKIRYVYQRNMGPSAARNTGLKLAVGKYVTLLDSDDYWDATFLEKMILLIKMGDLDIALCDNYRIEMLKGKVISNKIIARSDILKQGGDLLKEFLRKDLIGGPSRMICKKDILLNIGGYDEDLWLHQEWDLWIRFFKQKKRVGILHEPLYFYHVRNDGSNITRRMSVNRSVLEALRIYNKFSRNINSDRVLRKAFAGHFCDYACDLLRKHGSFILSLRVAWKGFLLYFASRF